MRNESLKTFFSKNSLDNDDAYALGFLFNPKYLEELPSEYRSNVLACDNKQLLENIVSTILGDKYIDDNYYGFWYKKISIDESFVEDRDRMLSFIFQNRTLLGHFLRGVMDSHGYIEAVDNRYNTSVFFPVDKPSIELFKRLLGLNIYTDRYKVNDQRLLQNGDNLSFFEWMGIDAVDLVHCLYKDAELIPYGKDESIKKLNAHVSLLNNTDAGYGFTFALSSSNALPPHKYNGSDAGYTVTGVSVEMVSESYGLVHTGLHVKPAFGWHFEIIPHPEAPDTLMFAQPVIVKQPSDFEEIVIPVYISADDAALLQGVNFPIATLLPRVNVNLAWTEVPFDNTFGE